MNRKPSEFQQHIHVYRAIAIIMIVATHVVPSFDWSATPMLGRVIDGIFTEASILFIFIAGYLFQHLSKRYSYGSYLQSKLRNVVSPYLIMSIPALVIFTMFLERADVWSWLYEKPVWVQVSMFLITGKHLAPFWFVPTVCLLYLLAPLFIWIDRQQPRLYWAIVPLMLLSLYLGRDGQLGPVNKAIYLLPIYLLGMCCSSYREETSVLINRYWLPLTAVMLFGFAGFALEWQTPPYYMLLMKASLSLLMIAILERAQHWIGHRLDYIADISFGIFFIHSYVVSGLKAIGTWLLAGTAFTGTNAALLPGSVWFYLIYLVAAMGISTALIWLATRVFGKYSRNIVGV